MLGRIVVGLAAVASLPPPPPSPPAAVAAAAAEAVLFLPCFDSDPAFAVLKPRQQFSWPERPGKVALRSRRDSCLTAAAGGGGEGPLHVAPCLPVADSKQKWSTADGQRGLAAPSGFTVCGDVPSPGAQVNNPPVAADIGVQRNFRAWLTGLARHNASSPGGACISLDPRVGAFRAATLTGEQGLCLSVGPGIRPCDPPSPAAEYPLCNTTLPLSERLTDLVRRIPAAEKPYQLVTTAPAINSLWIPPQKYWNEALHGLLSGGSVSPNDERIRRKPTEFPSALSSAAAFNRSLFWEIGAAVGTEARVESNAGTARGWTFWSPNVNIFRDPRCEYRKETAPLRHSLPSRLIWCLALRAQGGAGRRRRAKILC